MMQSTRNGRRSEYQGRKCPNVDMNDILKNEYPILSTATDKLIVHSQKQHSYTEENTVDHKTKDSEWNHVQHHEEGNLKRIKHGLALRAV